MEEAEADADILEELALLEVGGTDGWVCRINCTSSCSSSLSRFTYSMVWLGNELGNKVCGCSGPVKSMTLMRELDDEPP